MSSIKPTRDEMPILTLADRRAQQAAPAAPKFAGLATGQEAAELSVATLRERLDNLTMRLDRGWDRTGHPFKPMERRKLEIQADEVATCIEILTVNGNYYRERHEAMARLRPLTTK